MGREISGVEQVSTFLLELRSEEIPARMQAAARAELEKLFTRALADAGVQAGKITVWSTPRRLALIAQGLPAETQAVSEEAKGPRTSAPAQALEGFLRKTGLTKDQLTERDGVYYAVSHKPGKPMQEVLQAAIWGIVRLFPWPKSMRWGAASIETASLRWVRPLSGIVALLDGEVVPCTVGDVISGRTTLGHRFHAPGVIEITSAETYADQLRAAHVIVDHTEREHIVREGAAKAASAAGLTLGALHHYDPCQPADRQAANFVTVVPRDAKMLPPAVELAALPDACPAHVSDAAVVSELMTFLNQIETHTGKAAILKVSPAFERRYHIARAINRNLWLERDRVPPDYAGQPFAMWTANSALLTAASDRGLRWVVVQR